MIAIKLGSEIYTKNPDVAAANAEYTHDIRVYKFKVLEVQESFPDKIIPKSTTYLIPTAFEKLRHCSHGMVDEWIKGSPGFEYTKCGNCGRKFVRRRK